MGQPDLTLSPATRRSRMKVFTVLLVSGLAMAHAGGDEWKMYKTYTDMKAMESCYGEENMKKYTVEVKKAVAKCHQVDAPELSLPPFKSTYRFINTLMSGASEMEQKQMQFTMKMMSMLRDNEHHYDNYHHEYRGDMHDFSSKYDSDNFADMIRDKMFEENMMEKMMSYKMQRESYDEPTSYSKYNPFENKNNYRERMAALLDRHTRDAGEN